MLHSKRGSQGQTWKPLCEDFEVPVLSIQRCLVDILEGCLQCFGLGDVHFLHRQISKVSCAQHCNTLQDRSRAITACS